MTETRIDIQLPGSTATTKAPPQKPPIKVRTQRSRSRRIRPSQGIRFYALNIKDDESLLDSIVKPPTMAMPNLEIDFPTYTIAEYQSLLDIINDWIQSVPLHEYTSRFKHLNEDVLLTDSVFIRYTDEDSNLIQTSIGNYITEFENFEDGKLLLTDEEVLTLDIRGLFSFYGTYVDLASPAANIKITSTYDPDADAIAFVPSKSMDIFLVPAISNIYAETKYYNGIHSYWTGGSPGVGTLIDDYYEYHDFLNAGMQILSPDYFTVWRNTLDFLADKSMYHQAQFFKTLPNVSAKRGLRDFYETPPYNYFQVYSDLDIDDFPIAMYTSEGVVEGPSQENLGVAASVTSPSSSIESSRLIFIIKKSGVTYYFWKII
jgi:hypothetical protein